MGLNFSGVGLRGLRELVRPRALPAYVDRLRKRGLPNNEPNRQADDDSGSAKIQLMTCQPVRNYECCSTRCRPASATLQGEYSPNRKGYGV
jgi:hypothetical protein